MQVIQIGFGNMVFAHRIIAIVGPDSSPIRRLIQDAKDRGTLIDASSGRKTRSVILMDSDHLILSSLESDRLLADLNDANTGVIDD